MSEHGNCPICGAEGDGAICGECAEDWLRRLEWLRKEGMPTLRRIAYRQVRLDVPAARGAKSAFPCTPLNIEAQQAYAAAETHCQLLAGRLGMKPFGTDRLGRRRTLRQWTWLLPMLEHYMPRLLELPDAMEWQHDTVKICERVAAQATRREERRLVGICPECHASTDVDGAEIRTPIYAEHGADYAVCPVCGSFLTLSSVRLEYLKSAGMLHITRTRGDAARWVTENCGVHVTGKDLDNWARRGFLHPKKVEGRYWEWNIEDLIKAVREKRSAD